MTSRIEIKVGDVYGRLTILDEVETIRYANRGMSRQVRAQCVCGRVKTYHLGTLISRKTTSCGCYRQESLTTHGRCLSPEYKAWAGMKNRCLNPNLDCYYLYGGRGITVCSRWMESFDAFYQDVGPRPDASMSIDRIDVEGNYEPGNVRWASSSEQANNKRTTRLVTYRGRTQSVAMWAREIGMSNQGLQYRLNANWPLERALEGAIE